MLPDPGSTIELLSYYVQALRMEVLYMQDEKLITVTVTQSEANALFTCTTARLDYFTQELKAAGKEGNSARVLEISKWMEIMKSAMNKLTDSGARFWC